jgi:hypothetical protein
MASIWPTGCSKKFYLLHFVQKPQSIDQVQAIFCQVPRLDLGLRGKPMSDFSRHVTQPKRQGKYLFHSWPHPLHYSPLAAMHFFATDWGDFPSPSIHSERVYLACLAPDLQYTGSGSVFNLACLVNFKLYGHGDNNVPSRRAKCLAINELTLAGPRSRQIARKGAVNFFATPCIQ